jgi:hypothetical protein
VPRKGGIARRLPSGDFLLGNHPLLSQGREKHGAHDIPSRRVSYFETRFSKLVCAASFEVAYGELGKR